MKRALNSVVDTTSVPSGINFLRLGGVGGAIQRRLSPICWTAQTMRFYVSIAGVLLVLGCSEPCLDLHLIRATSSPIKSGAVEATFCEHCVFQTWVAPDGTPIELKVERDPYLSIPAHRISEAEIIHEKGLYRPYCESFTLSFRVGVSISEMTEAIEKSSQLPSVAIIGSHAVDVGRHIFNGETLTLAFSDRQRAVETADLLGASPSFREADDSWRAEAREQLLAMLAQLQDNPAELRRVAKQHGLQPEGLEREDLASQLFCP